MIIIDVSTLRLIELIMIGIRVASHIDELKGTRQCYREALFESIPIDDGHESGYDDQPTLDSFHVSMNDDETDVSDETLSYSSSSSSGLSAGLFTSSFTTSSTTSYITSSRTSCTTSMTCQMSSIASPLYALYDDRSYTDDNVYENIYDDISTTCDFVVPPALPALQALQALQVMQASHDWHRVQGMRSMASTARSSTRFEVFTESRCLHRFIKWSLAVNIFVCIGILCVGSIALHATANNEEFFKYVCAFIAVFGITVANVALFVYTCKNL